MGTPDRRGPMAGQASWRAVTLVLLPVAFLVATLVFWRWSTSHEEQRIHLFTREESVRVADAIAARLQSYVDNSAGAAERWQLRDPHDRAEWDYDLFRRRWLTPELETVEWIGGDFTARWWPSDQSALAARVVPREELERSVQEHRVVLAGPFFLPEGDAVCVTIVPVERGSEPAEWVISIYRLGRMLGSTRQISAAPFAIAVAGGGREIFASHPDDQSGREAWGETIGMRFGALSFDLEVWPTAATLARFRTRLPQTALLGGLLATAVLALGFRLAQVSSRRASEARIAASLQEEVQARKRAERSLERKVRELSRSNQEFERFAYAVSHDLRDPLNAIALNLQSVLADAVGDLAPEDRVRLEQGSNAVGRLDDMIRRLLDYARAGSDGDSPELIETAAVLDDATANLQALIEEHGAAVAHGRLPAVIARRSALTSLFQNLVSNAIKYRGERPPVVRVNAEVGDDEWVFSVADNARGMDGDQVDHAFDLFWRHSGGAADGNGIGLAVSKRLVERHGGRIWIESRPGEGTTFFFTLPSDPEAAGPRRNGEAGPRGNGEAAGPRRNTEAARPRRNGVARG